MFSKKATQFEEILTIDLTLSSKCQGEDFVSFGGLPRKHELYEWSSLAWFLSFIFIVRQEMWGVSK